VHVRALADVDGDGRVDRREFSIAMYLIKRCLLGHDLPSVLPASLKTDVLTTLPAGLNLDPAVAHSRTMTSVFGMPISTVEPLTAPRGSWSVILSL